MFELKFDSDEFAQAVEELVPSYQKNLVLSGLLRNNVVDVDFDMIGVTLTGERAHSGFVVLTGANASEVNKSLWGAIKKEIYDFFCTTSEKYLPERTEGAQTIKSVIVIIATAVAAHFHIAAGVCMGAVTVGLMGFLKIGRNAWCEMHQQLKASQ